MNHAHQPLDVSHCIVLARRLELPDSLVAVGPMSLKQLANLPASCAELKRALVGIQWPPACSTTPSLVEATEHGGITVVRSMRFEAVMEIWRWLWNLIPPSLRSLSYLI